jgi:hypothetical protein
MNIDCFFIFIAVLEFTAGGILKAGKSSHFIYPSGKPRIPHLLRLCASGALSRIRGKVSRFQRDFTLHA